MSFFIFLWNSVSVLKDIRSPAAIIPADRQHHINPLDRGTSEVQSKSQWIEK